jgi:hypothetical protein
MAGVPPLCRTGHRRRCTILRYYAVIVIELPEIGLLLGRRPIPGPAEVVVCGILRYG